jgi:hypothetical protein
MLVRACEASLALDPFAYPEHIVVLALSRQTVGEARVMLDRQEVEPFRMSPLVIARGNTVFEYVLPLGGGRTSGTAGPTVVVQSAFREGPAYAMAEHGFRVFYPADGGGYIQLLGNIRVGNASFRPGATAPNLVPREELVLAFDRTHYPVSGSTDEAQRRRQERIQNFDLREVSGESDPALDPARALASAAARREERVTGHIDPTPHQLNRHERILRDLFEDEL